MCSSQRLTTRNWKIQIQIVGLHLQDQRLLLFLFIKSEDTEKLYDLPKATGRARKKKKKIFRFQT